MNNIMKNLRSICCMCSIFLIQSVLAQQFQHLPQQQQNNNNQNQRNFNNVNNPNNPLGISRNYTAPPPSGLGQSVNIVQPMSLPAPPLPPFSPLPIRKKLSKAFNDFEQSQLTSGQVKRLKKQNLKNRVLFKES